MKFYPSFNNPPNFNDVCYVWDKYDGSSICCEFNKKKGAWKFGSKTVLIDETHDVFGEVPNLIKTKYEKDILHLMKKNRLESITCYFEFFGPNSEFGIHQKEEHDIVLFDCFIPKIGIIDSKEFINIFGKLDIPNLVHVGKINKEFIENVWNFNIEGITKEGVVCKGKFDKRLEAPYMFKLKTKLWLDRLREIKTPEEFEQLK